MPIDTAGSCTFGTKPILTSDAWHGRRLRERGVYHLFRAMVEGQ